MMDSGGDQGRSIDASIRDGTEHVNREPTLVLGDLQYWMARGRALPDLKGFRFADVDSLGEDLLQVARPSIILSPLRVRDKDAFDIARHLVGLGYTGTYRVLAQGLPKPELVRQDIRTVAPGLDFAIINIPDAEETALEKAMSKPN